MCACAQNLLELCSGAWLYDPSSSSRYKLDMRCPGQWMQLKCSAGLISATDYAGNHFQWGARIKGAA